MAWLLAIGDPLTLVPAPLTFTCRCGTQVAIRDGRAWPFEHLRHVYPDE